MNVLIVGNGFDIAHKLPTKYTSFLDFIKFINRFETYHGTAQEFKLDNENYKFSQLDTDVQKYISEAIEDDMDKTKDVFAIWNKKKSIENKSERTKHIEEMIQLSKDNMWFKWFQEQLVINPNWIDFEAEISRVVQEFEKSFPLLPMHTNDMSKYQRLINKHIFKGLATKPESKSFNFEEYKSKMLDDLNNLIRCFEIYLEDCIRNIDKQLLSPDIYNLRIDCLLCFNYTDTYSRLYSCKNRNIEYDYIHGKSQICSESANNMVLGIDDYLLGEERFNNTDFIEFKKFYQRLYKKTGCVYKKWLERINKSKDDSIHNVYIFGHSLAMTDKDILTEFITNKKTRITIFYFDENQYSDQIINLVHMLGPDALNAMVYGANPKIIFKHQEEMINITDSEWEILNDRNQLWNIHNLDDTKIKKLLRKIKKKLNSSDTVYFYNQENVISLYDAIVSNCYTDYGLHDEFIKIAEQLYNPDNCKIFDSFDWAEPDFRGSLYCDRLTQQLIYDINELNYNIQLKMDNKLCLDNMESFFKKLVSANINEEVAIELFDDIFGKFKSPNDDCSIVWKCIYKIQEKCPDFDWRHFIETKIKSAKSIDKIRYRRILDVMDEQEYFEEMERSQDETVES